MLRDEERGLIRRSVQVLFTFTVFSVPRNVGDLGYLTDMSSDESSSTKLFTTLKGFTVIVHVEYQDWTDTQKEVSRQYRRLPYYTFIKWRRDLLDELFNVCCFERVCVLWTSFNELIILGFVKVLVPFLDFICLVSCFFEF